MNKQRMAVYGLRRLILEGKDTRAHVVNLTKEVLDWYLDSYCEERQDPGQWNIDYTVGKRFRFGNDKSVMTRLEVYNLFNHHNMYLHGDTADVSSATAVTGFLDDFRRMQVAVKFEF